MLEERISTLIQSIDCLTAVINRLWDEKNEIRGVPAPEISAEPPKPKTTKKPAKKASPPKLTEDAPKLPLVKELEEFCLNTARKKGPKLKKKIQKQIKNTIKAHGGEMIADCPPENLPALKTALEAL
jgi:hypothetical protein